MILDENVLQGTLRFLPVGRLYMFDADEPPIAQIDLVRHVHVSRFAASHFWPPAFDRDIQTGLDARASAAAAGTGSW